MTPTKVRTKTGDMQTDAGLAYADQIVRDLRERARAIEGSATAMATAKGRDVASVHRRNADEAELSAMLNGRSLAGSALSVALYGLREHALLELEQAQGFADSLPELEGELESAEGCRKVIYRWTRLEEHCGMAEEMIRALRLTAVRESLLVLSRLSELEGEDSASG